MPEFLASVGEESIWREKKYISMLPFQTNDISKEAYMIWRKVLKIFYF
jgi:hypothetical protein